MDYKLGEAEMKINFKKALSITLFLGLLAWVSFYIKNNWADFRTIEGINWSYLLILMVLAIIYIVVQGLVLKIIVKPFGVTLKFFEWLGIAILTLLGNYIFPFSGFGFRAAYLKKAHGFNYTSFVGSLAAVYVIEFFVFTLSGLIGLWYWYETTGFFDSKLLTLFIVVFAVCLLLLCFSPQMPDTKNKFLSQLKQTLQSFYLVKTNTQLMRQLLIIVILEVLISSAIFFCAYRALHFSVSYFSAMVTNALSLYALLIRITPASFGFYEGSIVYTTKLINLTVANGLLVAMVTRLVSMIWVLALGPVFSFILIGRPAKLLR